MVPFECVIEAVGEQGTSEATFQTREERDQTTQDQVRIVDIDHAQDPSRRFRNG
jgi:hypothetical protein